MNDNLAVYRIVLDKISESYGHGSEATYFANERSERHQSGNGRIALNHPCSYYTLQHVSLNPNQGSIQDFCLGGSRS